MNIAQIIAHKRDGGELSRSQIEWVVENFTSAVIDDAQMSALAMAIFFRDMTLDETTDLTRAMIQSGQPLTWPRTTTGRPKLDKHSTGGIGDKISLPLAPLLAALGMDVPMISGRGLGPTGGTLDKLESIPGFNVNLDRSAFVKTVESVGCAIVSASPEFAPADKKLYALRDVTGTVPSIPLITASILSKKLSEGLDGLVMDVKWGSGAFMKTKPQAQALAQRIVRVSQSLGVPTRALLTDMNRPLGKMIGNACEVQESLDVLQGGGPADVRQLTLILAAHSLLALEMESDFETALTRATKVLDSGVANEKFFAMVNAQGGDLSAFDSSFERSPVLAQKSGVVQAFEAENLGYAVIEMGGGRRQKSDRLNLRCGLEMAVDVGDKIESGQPWVYLLNCKQPQAAVIQCLEQSIVIGDQAAERFTLVGETINV